MPLTALASPGPRVTTTAPGAPVRSAQVAAMIVAAVSPWPRTKRRPASAAAPTTSRFGPPPGRPNSSRVPAADSAPAIAAAARWEDAGPPDGAGSGDGAGPGESGPGDRVILRPGCRSSPPVTAGPPPGRPDPRGEAGAGRSS